MTFLSVSVTRPGTNQVRLFVLLFTFMIIGSLVPTIHSFTVLSSSRTKLCPFKPLHMLPPPEDCESEDECEINWGDDDDDKEEESEGETQSEVTDQVNENSEEEEDIGLSPEKIAEMIEVSFVNACMQLASGHIDVLKLFIVASKAGYESGITIPTLLDEVKDCPVQSANRPLMKEEDELRALWVQLVYLTLGTVRHSSDDLTCVNTVDESISNKYECLVKGVVQCIEKETAKGKEPLINTLGDISKSVGKDVDFSDLETLAQKDIVQNAIIDQSAKLVSLTMKVLEEEKFCFESGGQGTPPRPSIPGAYSD